MKRISLVLPVLCAVAVHGLNLWDGCLHNNNGCPSGSSCYEANQWYAQCRTECSVAGWSCKVLSGSGSASSSTPTPPSTPKPPTTTPKPPSPPVSTPTPAVAATPKPASVSTPSTVGGKLLAFPGAQGLGKFTQGGRGGSVYIVTTLADTGKGSLRDAISESHRIIVFAVSGVIKISTRLIFKSYQTIAGQTAPGGGITIYGEGSSFSGAHHVIVRYIRFRMGRYAPSGKDAVGTSNSHNLIFDHVSISWGRDGTLDLNPSSGASIYDITVQDSIVAQGLQPHSTGGLCVTEGTSIIRSLYSDNNSRNPKARGQLQFLNNVVYNWVASGYILGDTSGRSDGIMRGSYFIAGPESNGGVLNSPTSAYHIYADGNYYDGDKDGTLDGRLLGKGDYGSVTWETSPSFTAPSETVMTAQEALTYVLAHAGASKWRDAVDDYIVAEVKSYGKKGKTITNEDTLGIANNVGVIPSGTAPTDSDKDGMPDTWEKSYGLNANDASDAMKDKDGNGWVNLEEYINSLV